MDTVSCTERDCVMGVVVGHVVCRLSRAVIFYIYCCMHRNNSIK